jgi:putative hydrolase of the HAD superfamily
VRLYRALIPDSERQVVVGYAATTGIMADRSMRPKYRCIVFDFFGVICSEVAPNWLPTYFPPDEVREIRKTLFVSADRGDISQEALFDELAMRAGITPTRIESEWQTYVKINPDMVALMENLRGTVKLGLLSNACAPFVRGIIARHDLARLFDAMIISAEFGSAKPDPDIFRAMLATLAVEARDAVMIDDNPNNIAAAASLGMDTILFKSCGQLAQALSDSGVHPALAT